MPATKANACDIRPYTGDEETRPSSECLVSLELSIDQGETWLTGGTLTIPTSRYDAAARAFLVAAMTTSDQAMDVLWQVKVWQREVGTRLPPSGTPNVVLRSDGHPS